MSQAAMAEHLIKGRLADIRGALGSWRVEVFRA
jgi:hypothetical protein